MPEQTSPPAKRSFMDTILLYSFIASILLLVYLYNTEDTEGVLYGIADTIKIPVYIAGGLAVLRWYYVEACKQHEKERIEEEKEMAEMLKQARIDGVEEARREYAQAQARVQAAVKPVPIEPVVQACPVCNGSGKNTLGYVCPVCKGSGRA